MVAREILHEIRLQTIELDSDHLLILQFRLKTDRELRVVFLNLIQLGPFHLI